MMVHPAPKECIVGHVCAIVTVSVEYTGKAAHVAAFSWEGLLFGSGEVNHTREFNQFTNTPQAHEQTHFTATTLALTSTDALKGGEDLLKKIKEKFMEKNH
uniref:Uncharacterized protein n=1 Tax=Amphimedon queenslandica TaxID=400682 RepID=A0A1X7SNG2_AMPQE